MPFAPKSLRITPIAATPRKDDDMAKLMPSSSQPTFTLVHKVYEIQWNCPECEIDNCDVIHCEEQSPIEAVNVGDIFQCDNCECVFIVKQPPAKPRKKSR